MGRTLTNDQMRMALKGDRFKTVKKAITQEYMCLVKQELTAENVQKALDEGGAPTSAGQPSSKRSTRLSLLWVSPPAKAYRARTCSARSAGI